jgi:hypothetical protein
MEEHISPFKALYPYAFLLQDVHPGVDVKPHVRSDLHKIRDLESPEKLFLFADTERVFFKKRQQFRHGFSAFGV